MSKDFPKNFMWGAGTSSHQIEGDNVNDWKLWEDAGHVVNGQKSGKAANSWDLFEKDFDVAEKLGLNTYRFSIEWSRIEPEEGKFNKEALVKYRKMLVSLKKRGITPMVTLHHFTNPIWLDDWSNDENIEHFVEYVKYIVSGLGDLVDYWCTINEPVNMVLLGFELGIWPPGGKKKKKGLLAYRNFVEAHRQAYDAIHQMSIRKRRPEPMVGIPLSLSSFTPARKKSLLDRLINNYVKRFKNHGFLSKISDKLDFIGVNYYFSFHTKWYSYGSFTDIRYPGLGLRTNDMGWNIEPSGIYNVLMEMKKYDLPVIVTENGVPDAEDGKREWFIREHLDYIGRAIDDGVNVRGYLYWSLIDNFEWADGFEPRFGLAHVDYKTMKRTIRPSAKVYAKIIKKNSLEA